MSANFSNALFFLVNTLFELYLWALWLRIILRAVRADFYNPISQIVWQATQPAVAPLRRLVPSWRTLDTAAAAVLLVLGCVYIYIVFAMLGVGVGFGAAVVYAILKLLVLLINLYTFTIFVEAILSWVGPGVHNPASSVLWSMNEPVLRPIRRAIPPFSGLDLSPLVAILLLQVLSRLLPLPSILR